MKEKIFIASDHAGFDLKQGLSDYFKDLFEDLGTNTLDSVDYPDFAQSLVAKISESSNSKGILICGSGVGMSIAANRHSNIRAGLAFNSNIASLIRKHNDANVISLGARMTSLEDIKLIIKAWLDTEFEGGRHQKRIEQIEG